PQDCELLVYSVAPQCDAAAGWTAPSRPTNAASSGAPKRILMIFASSSAQGPTLWVVELGSGSCPSKGSPAGPFPIHFFSVGPACGRDPVYPAWVSSLPATGLTACPGPSKTVYRHCFDTAIS